MLSRVAMISVFAVAVLAAACSREQPVEPEPSPPVAETSPVEQPPEPVQDPPPFTPDDGADATDDTDSPAGTGGVTGFHGFGPARFGDDAEAVRIAWGRPLAFDRDLAPGDTCAYLQPDPAPSDEFAIAFMVEDGRFVRYDVGGEQYEAPGGGRVGNTREALESLYRDRFELAPHKYVDGGHYFRVTGPDGSGSALVFELGADDVVREWRIGLPPAVDYVEGCS